MLNRKSLLDFNAFLLTKSIKVMFIYKKKNIAQVDVNVKCNKCIIAGSCSDSQKKCNCDQNDNTERSDEGFLTYKDHLPVTELQFGDTGNTGERGWHTLGPLICSD